MGRGFGVFVRGSGWQRAFARVFSRRPPYTSSSHEKALILMFSFYFRPSGVANGKTTGLEGWPIGPAKREEISSLSVPLRLCQCERASIRFAAAESEGLARSILDRTSALTALAGLPAREDVRIAGHTTAPTEPRLAVAWGNGLRRLGADELAAC